MSALVLLPLLLLSTICRANLLEGEVDLQADSTGKLEYRLPKNAEPLTYDLHLEPDLQTFTFKGLAKIVIKMKDDVNTLTLNAKDLEIREASVIGNSSKKDDKAKNATNIQPMKGEFVTLTFNETLKKDRDYTLTIPYSGKLNNEKRGFYRSRYLTPNGTVKYIATTHFEPTGARQAFPCWDEPEYKAIFNISIKHLNNYTAIANTLPQSTENVTGSNQVITTFKPTPKMSTYLVAFVVSDYKTKNIADKFRVWTKEHALNQTDYALEVGKKVIEKLDEYTGLKYNDYMEKIDQISIKDFTAGAMENWGLVTYRESALLYQENVTSTSTKQSIATIIAHEFTHQWFGNLVSPKWWEYIWLNEGFATYFQYYIMDQLEPSWRLMEVYVTEALQGRAFVTDAGEKTRPMNKEVDSPSEISDLFDRIAYEKAGSVIRMMSHILTPEVFRKGLQNYLNKKQLSVAESDDLILELQATANKKFEGKDFKEIMDAWLNKPGYPVVNVRKTGDKLVITQERFTFHNTTDNTKWWVPIGYVQKTNPEATNTTLVAWLNPEDKQEKNLTVDKNDWVIVNVNQTGYYRVNYNKENWDNLAEALKTKDFEKISPLTRAQLIDDAFNLARANRLKYSVALSLATYLNKDQDYIPWNTAFRNLNFLHSKLQTTKKYSIFQTYVRYLMATLTEKVKYEISSNDTHVTKILKTNMLKWGCKVQEKECTKYARKAFDAWINNATVSPLNADLKSHIICAGLRSASEKTWNATLKLLMDSTVDQDEKNTLLLLMGCSGSPTTLRKFLMSSLEKNSTVDFNIAVQAVLYDHVEGVDLVLDVLTNEKEKIKQLDKAEEKIMACIESLGSAITNKHQFVELTMFSAKMGVKPELLQSTVLKGTRNIEWMDSYSESIGDWLSAHEKMFTSSAATLAFTSFLMIFSMLITRFY